MLFCVNKETPYLKAAIDSILTQTHADFEFLIAANACEDSLVEKLKELTVGDSRVRLIRTNIGYLGFNLNYLADIARGEYLFRMDADDVSLPNRFARLAGAIAQTRPDVIGSWAVFIDEADKEIGRFEPPTGHEAIVKRLIYSTVICHPTAAIKREFLIGLRGYSGGLVSEDYDLWLRAIRAGGRLQNLPEHLLRYRMHSSQSSGRPLGYAEAAGQWLRELLIAPSLYNLQGFVVATAKFLLGTRTIAFIKGEGALK